MKKKIIWVVVILVLVLVAAYVGYAWNEKKTAKVVEGLLNQSEAGIARCLGEEFAMGDLCPGGETSAGGHTFCWGEGGLSIKCRK